MTVRGRHYAKANKREGFIQPVSLSLVKIGTVTIVVSSFILNLVGMPESNSYFTSHGSSDKSYISLQKVETQDSMVTQVEMLEEESEGLESESDSDIDQETLETEEEDF